MGSISSRQSAAVHCDSSHGFYERQDIDDSNHAQLLLDAKTFSDRNPGTFDHLHKMVRDISPNTFEGGKAILHIPAGENAQIGLNWAYSEGRKNKFNPVINFASSKSVRAYERKTTGSVEFDFARNYGFNLMHYFTRNSLFRCQLQSSEGKLDSADAAFTYFGTRYSLSGSLASHSMSPTPAIAIGHFLYRINENLDMGCELASELGSLSSLSSKALNVQPALAVKFSHGPKQYPNNTQEQFYSLDVDKQSTFLGIFSISHCQLFYKKHMAPGLQFLSSFMYNREGPGGQSSVASFGYMYNLPKLELSVRSSFDTTSTLQTSVEKFFKHGEDGMGLSFCIAHNFTENRTFTGLGVTIGK